MRKWLIILFILFALVVGALWWLGNSLDKHAPEPGETRLEIENVL